jgi:hypothetical protein
MSDHTIVVNGMAYVPADGASVYSPLGVSDLMMEWLRPRGWRVAQCVGDEVLLLRGTDSMHFHRRKISDMQVKRWAGSAMTYEACRKRRLKGAP